MPCTATVLPGRAPLLRSELNVVTPAHSNGPASTADSDAGIRAAEIAGTTAYSA